MKGVVKGLIAGGIIIGIGIAVLIIGLSMNNWKLKGDMKFEMATYTAEYEYTDLYVDMEMGSLRTEFYDGDRIIIEYPTAKNFKSEVRDSDNMLIWRGPKSKWYLSLLFSLNVPDTVVKLPKGNAYNLQVNLDAGSIKLADGVYGDVTANTDAGQVKFDTISCNKFNCVIDAGNISCKSLTSASTGIRIDAGSADVSLLDSSEITMYIDAGNIKAKFAGVNSDYNITSRVHVGHNNLHSNNNTTASRKANLQISAGNIDVSFAG